MTLQDLNKSLETRIADCENNYNINLHPGKQYWEGKHRGFTEAKLLLEPLLKEPIQPT